jgi:F-type H+-transporting ATPase subunit delta
VDVADELFAIADAIDSSNQLVRLLSDAGREAAVKEATARSLFADKVSPVALEVTLDVVRRPWSAQEDILDALEQVGVEAILDQAGADGVLETVEEELFQFSRTITGSGELASTLDDARTGSDRRTAIVSSLLNGRANDLTVVLARRAVGRRTEVKSARRLQDFSQIAAARRQRLVAVVTSVRPLSEQQVTRLGAILAKVYGREVQINLELSDDVVGGLRIQVGDDLFDATVLARLAQARTRLAA